jgi:DUF4097 and DUF4098 domain-containing protein YvlB
MRITAGLAIATAGVLIVALAGCKSAEQVKTEDQTQAYNERVTRVEITLDSGDVTFAPGAADTVSVSRHLRWQSGKPVVTEKVDGSTMRISITCPKHDICEVGYRLTISSAASVHAHTNSGNIALAGITGDLDLDTDSGDVTVDGAAGVVHMASDSGFVRGNGLRSGDVQAKAHSGDITLGFVAAPVTVAAQAKSGNVTITVPRADGGYRVNAKTESGNRNVTVDEAAAASHSIVATVDSGDITIGY